MKTCDYFIIWAGIAWISLYHKLEWDIILADPEPFSYKIWESHIPNVLHADLGILKLIPKIKKLKSFSTKKWTIFADSKNKKYENMIFTELTDLYAFHAQRSELERLLVKELKISYVKERVEDIDLENSIVITNKNTYKVNKYILDCSWPRKFIANKLGALTTLENWWDASAKWWYWDIEQRNKNEKNVWEYTLLNHISDGLWLWQIPLYNTSILSVGVVSLKKEITTKEYENIVQTYKHPYYASLSIRIWDDELSKTYNKKWFSKSSTVSSWKNFILIWDAYSFTDPIFSIGTGTAISEAVFIAQKLNDDTFDAKEYDEKCKKVMSTFLDSFKLWYNDGWKDKFNLSLIQKNTLQWNILKDSFHNFESTLASYITLVTGLEKIYIWNHQDIEEMKRIVIYFSSENYCITEHSFEIWYIWLNRNVTIKIIENSIQEIFMGMQDKVLSMFEIHTQTSHLESKEQKKLFLYIKKLVDQKIIPTYFDKNHSA